MMLMQQGHMRQRCWESSRSSGVATRLARAICRDLWPRSFETCWREWCSVHSGAVLRARSAYVRDNERQLKPDRTQRRRTVKARVKARVVVQFEARVEVRMEAQFDAHVQALVEARLEARIETRGNVARGGLRRGLNLGLRRD
jgi:hypothetical protein